MTAAVANLPGRHRVEHVMGMAIILDVRDPEIGGEALDAAFDWFRRVDETFSTYRPDSEICRIDRGELNVGDADPDVREVLERCEQLREETGGYFDARAGGRLDPSGLVKGWSVDRAGAILDAAGARNYSIFAGGDILVRGRPLPDERWLVGIQHPYLRDQVAAVVAANDLAIATSGAYARGEHVLDPRSGRPPRGLLSVTVVGPGLGTVDAYATAAFAMGKLGPGWTARLDGYGAMSILGDETVLTTPGFPSLQD